MKKYIFLIRGMYIVGGVQSYVASKTEYLKKNGWDVCVICGEMKREKCAFSQLDEYAGNSVVGVNIPANYCLPSIRKKVLDQLLSIVGEESCDEIIIETCASIMALWGELLAERLSAKHICFTCDERFRDIDNVYVDNLEFFDFKHKRGELAGIHDDSLVKLFDGYKDVPENERYVLDPREGNAVQDIKNDVVENISRCEWNICYIGRINKPYVNNIIDDVSKFSIEHSDKTIQFIIVGDAGQKRNYINKKFKDCKNVKLTLLGNLVPIPQSLFLKTDVVIAGAGCAVFAASAGALTLIADSQNFLCNGIYGYETFSTLCHEPNIDQTRFDKALERVFVEQKYKGVQPNVPGVDSPNECYDEYFAFVRKSDQNKSYYTDFKKGKIRRIIVASSLYYLKQYFPWLYSPWLAQAVIKSLSFVRNNIFK